MDAFSAAGMCVWLMLVFAVKTGRCQVQDQDQDQVQVQAIAGEDVLLPCHFPQMDLLPEKVNVSWRTQGAHVVVDMEGVQNATSQHQNFRGRVVSFPELYRQGNFSIVLQDVQQVDSGVYECHMVVDFRQKVQLGVSGKPTTAISGPEGSGGDVIMPSSLRMTLLSVLIFFFFS